MNTTNITPRVITIDGTAGSGKGTISLKLAQELGWHFLDSGVLYRALGVLYLWHVKQNHSKSSDSQLVNIDQLDQIDLQEDTLVKLAVGMQVDFYERKILLSYKNHQIEDITSLVRSEFCGNLASRLALFPTVRDALLSKQREFLKAPGLVADGRDMGTVVFPEAIIKFFLDADANIRASRRHLQLKELGVGGNLHNRVNELSERDLRDSQRVVAPLKPAADAIIIDTTTMTINEVFAIVVDQVNLIV